jgi:hypothetical protein
LGLVRYAAHPALRTSFHSLDTADVKLDFQTAVLGLNDALSVVYVTHTGRGAAATLLVLFYA